MVTNIFNKLNKNHTTFEVNSIQYTDFYVNWIGNNYVVHLYNNGKYIAGFCNDFSKLVDILENNNSQHPVNCIYYRKLKIRYQRYLIEKHENVYTITFMLGDEETAEIKIRE